MGWIRDPLPPAVPGQGRGAPRLSVPGQPAGALVPFLDAADDRETLPGSTVHLAATGCFLGRLPVLHVIGGIAAYWTVPDADDDLVLPRPHLPAQLPADTAGAGREHASVPGTEPRLAANHLPGLYDQRVLPPLLGVVRAPRPGRRVGPDRRLAGPGTGARRR